jgi:phage terminase large subunit
MFTALTAYPWDGGTPSLQIGLSIRDQLIAAGRRVKVMPQLKREIGIQAARTIFGKCYFDAEKCADGIQVLRHYRYEADEAHLDPSGKPGLASNWTLGVFGIV